MTLRLGILETGRPPEELADDHPDYPNMVANWLALPDYDLVNFPVLDDEFPASPAEADIWVITGSKHGAYEDHSWIPPLEAFIRECHAQSVPLIGICFGHQIIAQALGGVVRKSEKGWGVGVHEYAVSDWPDVLGPRPQTMRLEVFHQDQVEAKPEVAEVLAQSEFCENAALWYPGFAVTFQGHPEYDHQFAADLLKARSAVIPADRAEAARSADSFETTRAGLAEDMRNWIATKIGTGAQT